MMDRHLTIKQLFWIALIGQIPVYFSACESKLKLKTRTVGSPALEKTSPTPTVDDQNTLPTEKQSESASRPIATPVEVPDLMLGNRTYYQSRSVIVLKINSEEVRIGDQISLFNDSTQMSLIDRQSLALGLRGIDESGISKFYAVPYTIQIKLYPSALDSTGLFAYGENNLRLLVNDEVPTYSRRTVHLRDFSFGTPSTGSFDSGKQSSGGLQGSIETMNNSIVTNGKATLTTGVIWTVNQ